VFAVTGQRPGRPGRAGNGEAWVKTKASQSALQIGKQALLAAEKLRGTRNVQEQAIGAACFIPNRYVRAIAHRPDGKLAQGVPIGSWIGIAYLQIEDFGAGVGEELTQAKTASTRRPVEANNALATFAGSDEHERLRRIQHRPDPALSRQRGGLRPE
jgi:hypothetical protein